MNMDVKDRFIDAGEVCNQIGCGKTKLWEMVSNGEFPCVYYPFGRSARWSEIEVQEWIRLQKAAIAWKERNAEA